jgi:hypothetical protein
MAERPTAVHGAERDFGMHFTEPRVAPSELGDVEDPGAERMRLFWKAEARAERRLQHVPRGRREDDAGASSEE